MGFWTGLIWLLLALLGLACGAAFSLIGQLSEAEKREKAAEDRAAKAESRTQYLANELANERQARQRAEQLRREETRRTAETVQRMEREAKALQGQLDIANQILRKAGHLRKDS